MPWKVMRYEQTPNPNALKLILDGPISFRPRSFRSRDEAAGDALAADIFAASGVACLLFSGEWMTVNKTPDAKWPAVKQGVERALAEAD